MRFAHLILPALFGVVLVGCGPDERDRVDTTPRPEATEPTPPATAPSEPMSPTPNSPRPAEPESQMTPTPPPATPRGVPEESDLNSNPGQD